MATFQYDISGRFKGHEQLKLSQKTLAITINIDGVLIKKIKKFYTFHQKKPKQRKEKKKEETSTRTFIKICLCLTNSHEWKRNKNKIQEQKN